MGTLFAKIRRMNAVMFLSMMALVVVGTMAIYSAGSARSIASMHHAYAAHLKIALFSLVLYFAFALTDYRRMLDIFAVPAYVLSTLLLVVVLLVGSEIYGGRRWLWFFQPSEVAKLALILLFAAVYGLHGRLDGHFGMRTETPSGWKGLSMGLALIGIPAALVFAEPDLGTTLVIVPTGIAMLFAARVCWKGLVAIIAVVAVASAFVLGSVSAASRAKDAETRDRILARTHLKAHQIKRLQVFLNPDSDIHGAGYTLRQSRISVGSGGLYGRGWMKGEQYRLGYLPPSISMNDFIFAVLAEEAGFAGSALVLVLYAGILFSGLWVGLKCRDDSGRILAVGVTTLLFCHVYVNVAMNIGLVPITGLPLPFISSGRTFMVVLVSALGVLQSVSVHGNADEADYRKETVQ